MFLFWGVPNVSEKIGDGQIEVAPSNQQINLKIKLWVHCITN
jgi:hypothetical protein